MSKNILKRFLTNTGPKPNFTKKFINKYKILDNIIIKNFGEKNPSKIFYVIKRTPGAGMFSNLTFVLNHLKVAKKFDFIPIVDMQNYPSIYNESKKINGSKNSWEYYFKKLSNYSLSEVYKSKNVLITDDYFEKNMSLDITQISGFKKLKKNIQFNKNLINEFKVLYKKLFKNEKNILGIHFRGTTYKTARGHAFPLSKKLMIENINYLINKFKYKKIFLVTEEDKYLEYFKKVYKEKLIYCNFYRSKKQDAFKIYPRKLHRYKLGKEIILETLLLSKCKGLTFVKSNVSSASLFFSKKKNKNSPSFYRI